MRVPDALQALDQLVTGNDMRARCGCVGVPEQDAASAKRSITHGDPASSPLLVVSPEPVVFEPCLVPTSGTHVNGFCADSRTGK